MVTGKLHILWDLTVLILFAQTGLLGFVPFDPLNLCDDYKRQSEVRNGRWGPMLFVMYNPT